MGLFGAGFGAVAGAGLGVASAGVHNKRVQDVARRRMARVNEKITQMRTNKITEMGNLSRSVRATMGDASNANQAGQAVTETLASRVVANAARDQDTIDVNLERGEAAAEAEKIDIAAQASAETKNKLMAGLEGALAGAGAGASLGSAISGAVQDGQLDALARENGLGTVDIARSRVKFQSARRGAAGEAFNLTKASTNRITSRISRSSVRQTFSTIHLPVAR